jgi:thioredoxin-dependent peroxiredoxin
MRLVVPLAACAVIFAGALAAQTAPPKTHLKVGDTAPDFTLPATTGKQVSLGEFRGKKNVILAFFPAAFTGGCTKEMLSYQAGIAKFDAMETQVFGISTDFIASQKKFAEEVKASFPLLSDHMRKVSKDYGVLMEESGLANRSTFVVDTDGKITHIEEGKTAVDPNGAETACRRLKRK